MSDIVDGVVISKNPPGVDEPVTDAPVVDAPSTGESKSTFIRMKLSDDYKFYDLEGNEILRYAICYSKELSRIIINSDEITTFLISSESKIHYASRDARSNDWVVFNEFEYELKESIKRKLGHPIVRVELTERHLKDSIDEAITEISPWVVQPESITVDVSQSIDLSEYNIAYVINVVSADAISNVTSNGGIVDVFATNYQQSSTFRESLYNSLELGLLNRTMSQARGGMHWKWNAKYQTLMVDVGSTNSKRVTVEYSPKIKSTDDLVDEMYLTFIKRFTLAFAREILAGIRGKFTVDGSPVSLDADTQDSKSSSELERLRQELKDTVSTHFMID